MRNYLLGILIGCLLSLPSFAQSLVTEKNEAGAFPVVTSSATTAIYVDENDDWLVQKTASLLQQDIANVTGKQPAIVHTLSGSLKNVIILGTIQNCSVLRDWKMKISGLNRLSGQREAFALQSVAHPTAAIQQAFVIAGSDKRGAAYGAFELSRQMGVSPWYWWADVPVKKRKEVYVKKGAASFGPPSIKYRGIFINDEAPAFSGWAKEKFGGANHLVYEKMFELMIRLKANYLWPAMWGNAFNDDDTLNPVIADKWGIVMGTSHHEPMLRAQQEWKRYGKGAWDYTINATGLDSFWKKGIENMGSHESIVTIGMRGDGDEPMTTGTATHLLERIVANQRKIIEEVTQKPASKTPQVWALYKEVQDYYDKGMRVPDDVTLLLCDDNWGNIRRLPSLKEKQRAGGYGIYYHFDYVGGPRNYKWLNTNNISRVWEQMHLAYQYNARQIWIVNVGDLKPMEFPVSFFLDYAWNVNKWNPDNLLSYYTQWATEQFGAQYGREIGNIIQLYTQYNARRKPELLNETTYSIDNYDESNRINEQWDQLLKRAEGVYEVIPKDYQDAFFQLVLHPVKACANLQHLYSAVAMNRSLSRAKNVLANKYADDAKKYFAQDSVITQQYHQIANGKWNHMMDQTHIGYTSWQEPRRQKMPDVFYVSTDSLLAAGKDPGKSKIYARAEVPAKSKGRLFYELDGYISMQASHYTRQTAADGLQYRIIPGIGRDGDGVELFAANYSSFESAAQKPVLEYEFYAYDTGAFKIHTFFSPTLNFHNSLNGLQYEITVDEENAQVVSINNNDSDGRIWGRWVSDNIIEQSSRHILSGKTKHIIRIKLLNPGMVLQKILIDFGGLQKSYLGPKETLVIH
ncbi:glycosyl hydrolase 115 family protein [Pinibacter aurantiacus]|uniref:Glycosyl hydrolase 115 family protein n=1 Tax=Pinibacter aurantiacus TaxID=2851599 RepID=A0A9E2SER4_9BACT|nr:glycosyl hydrolase 115 family protein [Pinibacter aurantiacus]MBV4358750.1 glycosyl hydrolase 115 family protein [Pinibacter aurantiacus]